jgi:uncharacterized SAM-binding protein YcdF (DUF218 family)
LGQAHREAAIWGAAAQLPPFPETRTTPHGEAQKLGYCEQSLHTPNQSMPFFPRLHAWLSPADAPRSADLIFVLAGRMHRKEYALELFRQGLAARILLSVGRFEIRRFSKMDLPVPLDLLKLAQDVPPPHRHYFVFFEGPQVRTEHVLPRRFGTLTEIDALARWLSEHPDIGSVLIVSSDSHLRRIRMCCRSLLSPKMKLAFLAAPLALDQNSALASAKEDLMELCKLAIYWVLLKLP